MSDAPVASRSFIANLFERFRGGELTQRWASEGASFGKFAAKSFDKARLGPGHSVIGYTAANLEQLIMAKNKGAKALHVQVDPGLSWYEMRRREQLAHPEAEELAPMPSAEFIERISREWQKADKVIVHSEHSRAALLAQGVDASRCVVIPPAFKSHIAPVARRADPSRPFRVLFVGNHCLAKGYHVFVDAARKAGKGFEFISVGSQTLKSSYLEEASRHVTIFGPKSQTGVREQMERADGFGLVQLEAIAVGLPVIATACCGEVVQGGINGRIVPPRDATAIVTALRELREDQSKYEQFSHAASERARDFSTAKHFAALMAL
jgi:glycosyltransferase involved in cell wall biosynthesis